MHIVFSSKDDVRLIMKDSHQDRCRNYGIGLLTVVSF